MRVFSNLHLFHPESRKVYFVSMQPLNLYKLKILFKLEGFLPRLCRCYTDLSGAWWNALKMLFLILHTTALPCTVTSQILWCSWLRLTTNFWKRTQKKDSSSLKLKAQHAPSAHQGCCGCWQRLTVSGRRCLPAKRRQMAWGQDGEDSAFTCSEKLTTADPLPLEWCARKQITISSLESDG